ncbi:MAG TPA: dienelactone hydrolase family protein, partial [Acidimicrobiales bacterium]|nr:dienelactone hydrolase family protein [Acidimicrobiales bacterium]
DWSKVSAAIEGHFAEKDGFFGPDAVAQLQSTLDELGKDANLIVYPGVDHAFFNDTRPEVYDETAADLAWTRTLELLRAKLG